MAVQLKARGDPPLTPGLTPTRGSQKTRVAEGLLSLIPLDPPFINKRRFKGIGEGHIGGTQRHQTASKKPSIENAGVWGDHGGQTTKKTILSNVYPDPCIGGQPGVDRGSRGWSRSGPRTGESRENNRPRIVWGPDPGGSTP